MWGGPPTHAQTPCTCGVGATLKIPPLNPKPAPSGDSPLKTEVHRGVFMSRTPKQRGFGCNLGARATNSLGALIGLQSMSSGGPWRPFAPPAGGPPWFWGWGPQFFSFKVGGPPTHAQVDKFYSSALRSRPHAPVEWGQPLKPRPRTQNLRL